MDKKKKLLIEIMEADEKDGLYEQGMTLQLDHPIGKHNKEWFIEKIGQRVFRTKSSCQCKICEKVYQEGLIIQDEFHAKVLYDYQNELGVFYYYKNK